MRRPRAWAAAAAAVLVCALGVTPAHAAAGGAAAPPAYDTVDLNTLRSDDPAVQARIDDLARLLPADWQDRAQAARESFNVESRWTAARNTAIDPGDYVCTDTALSAYVDQQLAGVDPILLLILLLTGVLDFPTYDALLFETEATPQYFGRNGEYDNKVTHTMRDLRRFWDIRSDDINLVAMHGSMLRDVDRVTRTVGFLYGVEGDEARELAVSLMELAEMLPGGSDNPIYTFNAFAFTAEGETDPVIREIPDKIIMGDGILQGMAAVGLDEFAPKSILAHEYGHHVQYEKGLFDSPLTGPEATRRTELMADAFSTYFLTHARGQALNAKRVLGSARSFYEVGDCSFSSNGHHGTPNQRLASATWASDLASAARPQGHILPSLQFASQFENKLPELVAPDA